MGTDVLVISPCSGTKRFDAVIGPEEIDSRERTELLKEYPGAVASAAEMYTGREHEHIESAVQQLSKFANVDWRIISAGFGVLSAGTEIPPYECTFNEIEQVRQRAERMNLDVDAMTNNELVAAVGREKNIPQDLRQILAKGYHLVFVVLGSKYLIAAQDALTSIPKETTAFAFASKGSKEFIGDCYWIPATEAERSNFGTTWLELRGRELLTLTKNLESAERIKRIKTNPEEARELSISA
ncbi:hypothetical protein [Halobellus limi]|nr:hypothetical protein [Halobellus limi]